MGQGSNTATSHTTGLRVDPPITSVSDARVILLNGPPGSGKDTAGEAIVRAFSNAAALKFAGPIKRAVHADFNLPPDTPDDIFENCKNVPNDALFGGIPRQEYIHKSETDMKPRFGPKFYGRLALRSLWRSYEYGNRIFAMTDSGFADEAEPVIEFVGAMNCLLIRITADERGKNFKGDSRTYINLPGVLTVSMNNNYPHPAHFRQDVVNLVRPWLYP